MTNNPGTTDRRGPLRRGRWMLIAALVAAAAIGGWWMLQGSRAAESLRNPAPVEGVPVTTIPAARRDVPIYFTGIGNVQALYSVLVRARVDGNLDSVNFTEGQEVKKGDLLAVIDPRPYQAALEQAQGQLARDQAQLLLAQSDLNRYQTLLKQDSISHQQAENQRFLVMQYQGAIQTDQANIDTAKLNLIYCHIESPIDGRMGLRLVDPGNMVRATDTNGLVTVTQVHPIAAVFTLPEENLPRVMQAKALGPVKVLAYSADHKTQLAEGELLTPDNTIDMTSGTIKLKATFPNHDNRLWPGQFIEARLEVEVLRNVVTVPAVAVQRGQDGMYVYIVKPDSTVALRPVEQKLEQDGVAVVIKGLEGGEQVVLNGQSRLTEGVRVAARGAAAKPAGG